MDSILIHFVHFFTFFKISIMISIISIGTQEVICERSGKKSPEPYH